jgi:hypothetical protein
LKSGRNLLCLGPTTIESREQKTRCFVSLVSSSLSKILLVRAGGEAAEKRKHSLCNRHGLNIVPKEFPCRKQAIAGESIAGV